MDNLGGPNVITRILIREKRRQKSDRVMQHEKVCNNHLSLKMKKGPSSRNEGSL